MPELPPSPAKRLRRNWIIDTVILSVFFVALNYVFSPDDPGFFELNPSPYVIIPVLVGLWYGFVPGFVSGLVLASVIYVMCFWPELLPSKHFADSLYSFLVLPFVGGICGEAFKAARYQRDGAVAETEHHQKRTEKLASDAEHLRLIKDQLERQLLKQDSKTFSFDNEIRALYETPEEMLGDSILQSLSRTERVYDAGFYLLKDGVFELDAWLGNKEYFSETIDSDSDPMIRDMLDSGELRALPDFIGKESDETNDSRYLACFPLIASEKVIGVILIAGLPFINFERKTLRRIDTFCQWASQILVQRSVVRQNSIRQLAGHANRRIVDKSVLHERLILAIGSEQQLEIPFTLLLMRVINCPVNQEGFEVLIGSSIRAGDTLTVLEARQTHLLLLAPFTGARAEVAIESRIRSAWARGDYPADCLKLQFLNRETIDPDHVIDDVVDILS